MEIIQLLSAAGIGGIVGSLLTAAAQAWFLHRSNLATRNFQEKKEAYIGLLEAYRANCLTSNKETKNTFGFWSVRCELVAPKEIGKFIEEMKTADYEQQSAAFENLKELMRKDLGVHID